MENSLAQGAVQSSVEEVAKEVAQAIQEQDYTIASRMLKPYNYGFKKKVEALIPNSTKQAFEAICP